MTAAEILTAIPKLSALVLGDICLDRWCTYDPGAADISRETGIPRIGVVTTEVTPGAGGTVANNLAALGTGQVAVLGVIGEDGFGFELRSALAARGIEDRLMVTDASFATFTYTKLINAKTGKEDQPRVDFVNTRPLGEEPERQLIERLLEAARSFDVVLVSDQAETAAGGVVTPRVRGTLSGLAASRAGTIFFVDSRMRIEFFRHAVLKPNLEEAEAACRRLSGAVDLQHLRRHCMSELMIVTHGPRGVLLVEEGGETQINTRPVEDPVDICGAGDSFSAGAALALAAGATTREAASFGNLVASITIMKKGTGTASPGEVLAAHGSITQ